MTNNDVLRRLRYIFDFADNEIIGIFELAGLSVSREQVCNWLKPEDSPDLIPCSDLELATFLNGFITFQRGPKPGPAPEPETTLTNNLILTKLKIALKLRSEDMLHLLDLAGLRLGNSELSAFFRKPGHKHYRECKDQFLRNFLTGLQKNVRDESKPKTNVWRQSES